MAELIALCNKGNSLPTRHPLAPAPATVLPKLLLKAETMQAYFKYAGPDWKYLLIMHRDIIIAYAYIDEVIAVGFNTQTNLRGRFPIDIAKKVKPQPYKKVEIFIAIGLSSMYIVIATYPLYDIIPDNTLEYTSGKTI
jgi:hypothetical protein